MKIMSLTSRVCWCLWPMALTLMTSFNVFVYSTVDSDTSVFLQQKADYHLNELIDTINKMDIHHRLYKRDTATSMKSINISYSLQEICAQLNAQPSHASAMTTQSPDSAVNPSDKTEKEISYEDENHPSNWPRSELTLVSVEAERDGNMSHFTFNITHSSQAFVIRAMSLDFVRTTVGDPGVYAEPIMSQVQLSVNSFTCVERYYDSNIVYNFGLIANKDFYFEVEIDVCKFDQIRTEVNERRGTFKMKKMEGESFHQQLSTPEFRVLLPAPNNHDEILISPGEHSELYIDIVFSQFEYAFDIWGMFWDWDNDEFIETGTSIDKHPSSSFEENDEEDLLKAEIVHRFELNSTDVRPRHTSTPIHPRVIVRAKIIVNFGTKKLSGKLTLSYSRIEYRSTIQRVIRRVRIEKDIYLRLPYKLSALPREATVHLGGEHRCRNDGHRDSISRCVIDCFAEGSGIKSIFIVKNKPYVPPVKSVSYVLNGKFAQSYVDMGLPSPEINGSYQCVVVTEDGKIKSDEGTVVSFGFTLIHSTTLKDMGNGSAQITCEASGLEPLTLSLSLESKYSHDHDLDLENEIFTLDNDKNMTTLTVVMSIERLLFPIVAVECDAFGRFGHEKKSVDVSMYIESYNQTAPIVNQNTFTMKHFENGTTLISCSASGGKNVDVDIVKPNVYGHHEISFTEIDREKTILLYLPTRVVSNLYHPTEVTCRASNERGGDEVYIREENIEEF